MDKFRSIGGVLTGLLFLNGGCMDGSKGGVTDPLVITPVAGVDGTVAQGELTSSTAALKNGGFETSVAERGQLVFTVQMLPEPGALGLYNVTSQRYQPGRAMEALRPTTLQVPGEMGYAQLGSVSTASLIAYRLLLKEEAVRLGLPDAQDTAGCDSIMGFASCSGAGHCCDTHDQCLEFWNATSQAIEQHRPQGTGGNCNWMVSACFIEYSWTGLIPGSGRPSRCCELDGSHVYSEPGTWCTLDNSDCTCQFDGYADQLAEYHCTDRNNLDCYLNGEKDAGCDTTRYLLPNRCGEDGEWSTWAGGPAVWDGMSGHWTEHDFLLGSPSDTCTITNETCSDKAPCCSGYCADDNTCQEPAQHDSGW